MNALKLAGGAGTDSIFDLHRYSYGKPFLKKRDTTESGKTSGAQSESDADTSDASLAKTYKDNMTMVSFIILSNKIEPKAYKIAHNLRSVNDSINIDVQLSDGSLKSKLRRANKDNAAYALIIGEDELKSKKIIVKPLLEKNSEQAILSLEEINSFIKQLK